MRSFLHALPFLDAFLHMYASYLNVFLQELLADFKRRYDRERTRLAQALEKSQSLSRSISSILPTIQSLERDVSKDGINKSPLSKPGMYMQ
jgi:hypothetical protein